MVLLVAKQNWTEPIQKTLEKHVTKVFGMRRHTNVAAEDPDAFEFPFRKKVISLLEVSPKHKKPFTTFIEP